MNTLTPDLQSIVLPVNHCIEMHKYYPGQITTPIVWFKDSKDKWFPELRSKFTEEAITIFNQDGRVYPAYTFQECNIIVADNVYPLESEEMESAVANIGQYWAEKGCLYVMDKPKPENIYSLDEQEKKIKQWVGEEVEFVPAGIIPGIGKQWQKGRVNKLSFGNIIFAEVEVDLPEEIEILVYWLPLEELKINTNFS